MGLSYAAGPLGLQFGYQKEDAFGTNVDPSFTRLGATYDLGVAMVYATYGKASDHTGAAGSDATEYQFGLDYKLSGATTLSASYARSADNVTAGDFTRSGLGLGVNHVLSKRTSIYGGYESDTTTKTATPDAKHSLLAVGVRHAF